MKKVFILSSVITILLAVISCQKFDFWNHHHDGHGVPTKNYDASVAVTWARLQMKLTMSTPGFSPGVTARSFAYSGLALYESIQPGIPGYRSLASQLSGGLSIPAADEKAAYYWPAAANRAMAVVIKSLFAASSAANLQSIDSLESDFNNKFQGEANPTAISRAADFGGLVGMAVFDWSKTDGSQDVYPPYVLPVGPGLWQPTPPAFAPAAAPYSGGYRTFISGIAEKATAPAPTPYSESPGSDFYNMVNEVYTISLSLTSHDSTTVKFWADLPGQFNGPSHFTSVLTQLIEKEKLNLGEAAVAYVKHGIAMNDAGISNFKTKYTYNLVRPITYIRSVLGHPDWNTVIATPPHPEYTSAHAANMQAAAEVLKAVFGKNYSFKDHSFDVLYSRIIGGIHYKPSGIAGLAQGKKAGELVNKLRFKD